MRKIVHADFDGVVSALYLGLRDAEIRDYPEVPREPIPDAIIVEVYHPENVTDSTIIVDHHAPKVPWAPGMNLEGYVLCGRRLCWRAGVETPSMVKGVDMLARSGVNVPGLNPRPVPEPIIDIANALDNLIEPPESALRTLGVIIEPRRIILGILAAPRSEHRRMLEGLYERGLIDPIEAVRLYLRELGVYSETPPPKPSERRIAGWLVLIGEPESVRYWGVEAELRGEPRVAMVMPTAEGYTAILYSVDESALRIARSMGGGGRRVWGRRGFIAGFQARSIEEILSALAGRGAEGSRAVNVGEFSVRHENAREAGASRRAIRV